MDLLTQYVKKGRGILSKPQNNDGAFSTHPDVRIKNNNTIAHKTPDLNNDDMLPLFLAVIEASEEAIYNSLFMATDMKGIKIGK